MENINIEATNKTPYVNFNYSTGELNIQGRSIPENSFQFFEPLLEWLEKYQNNSQDKTQFTFKLDYFNTSSSMYILGILKRLEKIYLEGKQIEVKWYFDLDDEDMLQTGEDLKQIVKVPIHMIEIEGED